MSEWPPRIPLGEVFGAFIEIETPYSSLESGLDAEGFEITTDKRAGNFIVWISASPKRLHHRNSSIIALALTKNGIMHSPDFDSSKNERERFEGKLVKIELPQYENAITFTFENFGENGGKTRVRLATRCTTEILGSHVFLD